VRRRHPATTTGQDLPPIVPAGRISRGWVPSSVGIDVV